MKILVLAFMFLFILVSCGKTKTELPNQDINALTEEMSGNIFTPAAGLSLEPLVLANGATFHLDLVNSDPAAKTYITQLSNGQIAVTPAMSETTGNTYFIKFLGTSKKTKCPSDPNTNCNLLTLKSIRAHN
jgi:hypothetical protein